MIFFCFCCYSTLYLEILLFSLFHFFLSVSIFFFLGDSFLDWRNTRKTCIYGADLQKSWSLQEENPSGTADKFKWIFSDPSLLLYRKSRPALHLKSLSISTYGCYPIRNLYKLSKPIGDPPNSNCLLTRCWPCYPVLMQPISTMIVKHTVISLLTAALLWWFGYWV